MNSLQKDLTRRSFLAGGTIAGGAALLAATGLSGCQPQSKAESDAQEASASPSSHEWANAPEPIAESDINETFETDFLIVGAGVAGTVAAAHAIELGMKTIVIDARDDLSKGPNWAGMCNSKKMLDAGITLDRDEIINDLMWHANYRADQRLIQLWFDKSGTIMDWFTDIAESTGTVEIAIETHTKDTGGRHVSPAIAHVPVDAPFLELGPNEGGMWKANEVVLNDAIEKGLDLRYKTKGEQLVTDENGKVTGVIASTENGYTRFNASKGVLLATGGYINNEQMRNDLNPDQEKTTLVAGTSVAWYNGEGIKMGIWAGADLSDMHWWMDSDRGFRDGTKFLPGSQPWLRVDCYGNRFCNEDVPYDFGAYTGSLCPGHRWWQIFDNNYWEQVDQFDTTVCSRLFPRKGAINYQHVPQSAEEFYEKYITKGLEKGDLVTADTLDELIEQMHTIDERVDADTFKATIERYNELAAKGEDEDFGKLPRRLLPIEQGPFYAVWLGGASICNLDGLRINEKIEVLNKNGEVVPGLYAAGNDAGGFYGMSYPWYYGGLNVGFAMTFGYLAAESAATN